MERWIAVSISIMNKVMVKRVCFFGFTQFYYKRYNKTRGNLKKHTVVHLFLGRKRPLFFSVIIPGIILSFKKVFEQKSPLFFLECSFRGQFIFMETHTIELNLLSCYSKFILQLAAEDIFFSVHTLFVQRKITNESRQRKTP